MSLFFVSYDLVKEKDGKDYEPLKEALLDLKAVKTQLSAWYLGSTSDAETIYKYLFKLMDENDRLMVVEITRKPVWGNALQGTRDLISRYFR